MSWTLYQHAPELLEIYIISFINIENRLLHQFVSSKFSTQVIYYIADLDGLGSCQQGGQLLSDFQKLERATTRVEVSPEVEAG